MRSDRWRRVLFLLIALAGASPAAQAQASVETGTGPQGNVRGNAVHPEASVWIGTIVLVRSGHGSSQQEQRGKEKSVVTTNSRDAEEKIVIKACGEPGSLYVQGATRTLDEFYVTEENSRIFRTRCSFPPEYCGAENKSVGRRYAPRFVEPGNTMNSRWEVRHEILGDPGAPSLQAGTNVSLRFLDGNRYEITGSQSALIRRTSDLVTRWKEVCCGKTAMREVHERTGPLGQPGRSFIHSTGEGDSLHEVIEHVKPPSPAVFDFHIAGSFDGEQIADSKIIDRTDTADYHATVTATYEFNPRPSCREVVTQLQKDLAFAEA